MGVESRSGEISKVLFVAANQADVHRAGALAFHMPEGVQMDIYYTHNWMRMEDELLMKSLKSMNLKLIDETDLSLYSYLQVQWNLLAREYSSSSLKGLSNWAQTNASLQIEQRFIEYIQTGNYQVIFSSYLFENETRWQFLSLMHIVENQEIKLVQIPHAISLHNETIPGKKRYESRMLPANLFLFANSFDRDFRIQNMCHNSLDCEISGDPALSLKYQKHLESFSKTSQTQYECGLFIPSIETLGIYREVDWVLWINELLERHSISKMALKCHPNSSSQSIVEAFYSNDRVDVFWKSINAIELVLNCSRVLSTPSTVIFQAILCNKPVIIIDNFLEGIGREVLVDLELPIYDVFDTSSLSIPEPEIRPSNHGLKKYAWGNKSCDPATITWDLCLERFLLRA